jgi:hypothetical protein
VCIVSARSAFTEYILTHNLRRDNAKLVCVQRVCNVRKVCVIESILTQKVLER